MKRKQLVAVGILSICLLACGCGNNTTITGQDTVIVQESETQETREAEPQETEPQEAETQEAETQETETQETTETVEETENYENYEELVSIPVDGRDGSQEKPYQVGDEINFPQVCVFNNTELGGVVYSSLTVSVEEATSEYVKIAFEFGADFTEYYPYVTWRGLAGIIQTQCCDESFEATGNVYNALNELNDQDEMMNLDLNTTEMVLYYQDSEQFKGCTDDTTYIKLRCMSRTPEGYSSDEEQFHVYVKVTE